MVEISKVATEPEKTMNKDSLEQIARLLETAAAQVGLSLSESDKSVSDLAEAITKGANGLREINGLSRVLAFSADPDEIVQVIAAKCSNTESELQQALIAMQFYDRLSQRFGHIYENICTVAKMLDSMDVASQELLDEMYEKMRSVYSLEQERHIHDSIMKGDAKKVSIVKADDLLVSKHGDIELF